jgi:hypothetical protein
MKRFSWIFVSGFVLFMILMTYEGDQLPINRGTSRLLGLLLIVVAVYFSIESTRMALSAETITINDDIYLIGDINHIEIEQGRGGFMKSLVFKLVNNNKVRVVCLTLSDEDENKFSSFVGKFKVAKTCSDRRKNGLE